MTTDKYESPEVNDLSEGSKEVEEQKPVKPAVSGKQPRMPSFDEPKLIIGIGEMVNAKSTATTDVLNNRIDSHLKYLLGEVSFKDDDQRIEEQSGFITTLLNTLQLDFPSYVVVTDYILNKIRENQTTFSDGSAYRFCHGIERIVPIHTVRTFRNYLTLLSMIANNWNRRAQLSRFVDATYLMKDLSKVGKENVTQYFHKLMRV